MSNDIPNPILDGITKHFAFATMLTKRLHGSALRMATRCRPSPWSAHWPFEFFEPLATGIWGTRGTLAPWKRGFAEQAVYRQQLLDGNEEILTEAGGRQRQRVSVVTVPFTSCCNIILRYLINLITFAATDWRYALIHVAMCHSMI